MLLASHAFQNPHSRSAFHRRERGICACLSLSLSMEASFGLSSRSYTLIAAEMWKKNSS